MTTHNFVDSSTEPVRGKGRKGYLSTIPWQDAPVGKSLMIPKDQVNLNSLRCAASQKGKELGYKFSVLTSHDDVYELARTE